MERIIKITPRNSGFAGGKIGLDGNTVWLVPQKMATHFRQRVVRVDPVRVDPAVNMLAFYADRNITGIVEVSGEYETSNAHVRNALGTMSAYTAITDVQIDLDTGISYTGDLVVMSDRNQWSTDGTSVNFAMTYQFTGTVTGDGGSDSAFNDNGSGEILTNLKEVTGAASMAYTRSHADQREDHAVEPFIIVGITEASGVPLSNAEQWVVTEMGGAAHFWRGDATLPFSRINCRWAGVNLIVGELIYDRNALDCRAHQIEYDIGFVVKGSVGEVITGDSGSDIDNVCGDLASGPFAARFVHWRVRTMPYRIILLPCVFDTNPFLVTGLKAMIGTINGGAVTVDGETIAANEARFDGVKSVRKITTPAGSKYFGYLKLSVLSGGWTDGTLTCARLVPLPLEGGQTLPSYTVEASVVQLYEYTRATWPTIAALCPNCYA